MFRWICIMLLIAFIEPMAEAKAAVQEKVYTYEMLTQQLAWLKGKYKNELQLKTIGHSHFGRKIYAVKLGTGEKNILLIGAHHGREWLTSLLLMQMLETYADAFQKKASIGSYQTDILKNVSIWFVPMLNPDGVAIQQNQLHLFPAWQQYRLLYMNEGWDQFIRWKANGLGVDLNRQYPAGWRELPKKPDKPSYQFYKGKKPLEAAEVQALTKFVGEIQPRAAISYHTAGREIFWRYKNGKHLNRDHRLAKKMAELTGYKLAKPPKEAYGGGFTDWFIVTYHRPALTIELCPLVGDRHPPLSVFREEWERNKYVGLILAEEVKKWKN